jgi:RNA polymerase sigma factor (sigma-70 family)
MPGCERHTPEFEIAIARTDAWLERYSWQDVFDQASKEACAMLLCAQEDKDLSDARIHYVCAKALSPLLYARCTAKDESAHGAFAALHAHFVRRAAVLARGQSDAQEIASDTMLAVIGRLSSIRTPGTFLGYCEVALTNQARKAVKRQRLRALREDSLDTLVSPQTSMTIGESLVASRHDAEPEFVYDDRDARDTLWGYIQHARGLTATERRIALLRFKWDLSPKEIMLLLGISREAVDTALYKARRKLARDPKLVDKIAMLGYDCRVNASSTARQPRR